LSEQKEKFHVTRKSSDVLDKMCEAILRCFRQAYTPQIRILETAISSDKKMDGSKTQTY